MLLYVLYSVCWPPVGPQVIKTYKYRISDILKSIVIYLATVPYAHKPYIYILGTLMHMCINVLTQHHDDVLG